MKYVTIKIYCALAAVGIAGHSMGGQSTAIAANSNCTKQYNVGAAVLHHPATGDTLTVPFNRFASDVNSMNVDVFSTQGGNVGSKIGVPLAGFTSSGDTTEDPQKTKDIYEATPTRIPKMYRNLEGWNHLEPTFVPPIENPLLATYSAAWFKIYLLGQTSGEYYDLIYGNSSTSICNSANMTECIV